MSRLSGLSTVNRIRARDMAVQAFGLMRHNSDACNYTQDGRRWEGIDRHLKAWRGEFPRWSDCSSALTWALWNGLDHFHIGDIVNGANFREGYTGTLLENGQSVGTGSMQRGDAVIYGDGFPGHHTAMYVGGGMVLSHGGPGVHFLRYDQMGQNLLDVRRYL